MQPHHLEARAVRFVNEQINRSKSPFTRKNRATALRAVLRRLEESGCPKLSGEVVRVTSPRPRNITASDEERRMVLASAPPHLRCWLLLCSDLAIRSGTAAALTPESYDGHRRELTFTTKYQARQRLPVTSGLAELLDGCRDMSKPFVCQLSPVGHIEVNSLRKLFAALRKRLGIAKRLTAHDLRRTTATRVYESTHDLRLVQALLGHSNLGSTVWYLDHHLESVPLSELELAKLPTKGIQ